MSKVQFSPFLTDAECCDLHFGFAPVFQSADEEDEYRENLKNHKRYLILDGLPFLTCNDSIFSLNTVLFYHFKVPYSEKDKIKEEGFYWSHHTKTWYIKATKEFDVPYYLKLLSKVDCRIDFIEVHSTTRYFWGVLPFPKELGMLKEYLMELEMNPINHAKPYIDITPHNID
jgi:hypothetical protein